MNKGINNSCENKWLASSNLWMNGRWKQAWASVCLANLFKRFSQMYSNDCTPEQAVTKDELKNSLKALHVNEHAFSLSLVPTMNQAPQKTNSYSFLYLYLFWIHYLFIPNDVFVFGYIPITYLTGLTRSTFANGWTHLHKSCGIQNCVTHERRMVVKCSDLACAPSNNRQGLFWFREVT